MAKHYKAYEQNIIWYMCKKNKLSIADLLRALDVSKPTLYSYIENPGLIRLRELRIMAGFFGITIEVLVYCLNRTMPQIPKRKARSDGHKWYLTEKVLQGENLLREFEESKNVV